MEGVFEPYAEVVRLEGRSIAREDAADADVLVVRTRTRCDAALLEGSRVRLVVTATIGTDHIDTEWCRRHGIRVANAAGCNARGVLQWVAAVLVQIVGRCGRRPEQTTLGIVGVGHVGSLVREYAEMWGFRTLCCDPPREERERCGFLTLDEVFSRSDIVTFHTPLNADTRHMVNADLFARHERKPFIVNSSRGEVVDTAALLASGAEFAADVWEHEPNIDAEMLRRAAIATPHIAGYSLQGKANATAMSVHAVAAELGLPLTEWYPAGVAPSSARRIGWAELCAETERRYDIMAESARLKSHPGEFENMRNGYDYREEFF